MKHFETYTFQLFVIEWMEGKGDLMRSTNVLFVGTALISITGQDILKI